MNTISENPAKKLTKLFLLVVPTAVTFLLSLALMGMTNAAYVTLWQASLLIFSIIGLPLCMWFFKDFANGGYSLSKSIGLLSTSLLIWTLTYMKIYSFSQLFIILAMVIILVASLLPKKIRNNVVEKLNQNGVIEHAFAEELLFSVVLVLLCYFKGMYPDINGQEKFMNFGFMMSMLKSNALPANDMWLAGEHINYYYYGQYIYSMIVKFNGINPNYAYMISMCTSIAIPFVSAYTIGFELIALARKQGARLPFAAQHIAGFLSSLTTIIFGNSHSFFYDEQAFGNGLLKFLLRKGMNVGKIDSFFYPDSTRFIGHNPDSYIVDSVTGEVLSQGDYTIHEFPFYSYLVGDLHAHVISMMVVTLIAAFAIALVYKATSPSQYERSISSFITFKGGVEINTSIFNKTSFLYELKNLISPELIAISVLLGIATMTNYWDFLIYFIFCAMTLLVFNITRSKDFCTVTSAAFFALDLVAILLFYMTMGENVILHAVLQIVLLGVGFLFCVTAPSALTRTSLAMNFMFGVSTLIAVPFNLNFDMISNKLAKTQDHTSLFQFLIVWGVHLIITIGFVIFVIFTKNYVFVNGKKKRVVTNTPVEGYTNPIAKFFGERNLADVFACGMTITGLIMLIAPEIFYVRDIYTSGYLRSNTMFKFTFAGFIILSLVMAYAVVRLFWFTNKNGEFSGVAFTISIVFALLLLIPAHYSYRSLEQRSGGLSKSNFKTLDGTEYIANYRSGNITGNEGNLIDYKNAIDWINSEIKGDPVIVEAYGSSYTDYDMVSAYTGLPTIFGWQTHEWLWRYHGIVDEETDLLVPDPDHNVFDLYIDPRHADVDKIYLSADVDEIKATLAKYDVSYIVSGPIEFETYGYINNDTFDKLATVVYESGYVRIYEVNK